MLPFLDFSSPLFCDHFVFVWQMWQQKKQHHWGYARVGRMRAWRLHTYALHQNEEIMLSGASLTHLRTQSSSSLAKTHNLSQLKTRILKYRLIISFQQQNFSSLFRHFFTLWGSRRVYTNREHAQIRSPKCLCLIFLPHNAFPSSFTSFARCWWLSSSTEYLFVITLWHTAVPQRKISLCLNQDVS